MQNRPVISPKDPHSSRNDSHDVEAILKELLPGLMREWNVPGVSLAGIREGRIAWLQQYGLMDADRSEHVEPDTLFEACSLTKPIFAYAVLKLAEEGELDLHVPLVHYLGRPYIEDEERHQKITAWMVLTHSSGLPNWRPGGRDGGQPLVVHFEPGTGSLYSGEGFWFLQRAVEQITGMPLEDWMQKRLLGPLGMTSSSFFWKPAFRQIAASGHTESGHLRSDRFPFLNANAAFSLYTTPKDYALFLLEMMNPDRSAAHSLGNELLYKMLTRHLEMKEAASVQRNGPPKNNVAYTGLGWRIDDTFAGNRYYHSGSNKGFRCYAEFDPQSQDGLVIMTNADSGSNLWNAVIATIGKP